MGSCHLTLFKLFVFVVFFISYLLFILFCRFIFVLVYSSIHIYIDYIFFDEESFFCATLFYLINFLFFVCICYIVFCIVLFIHLSIYLT